MSQSPRDRGVPQDLDRPQVQDTRAVVRKPSARPDRSETRVEVTHKPLTDQAQAEQIRVKTVFRYFCYSMAALLVFIVAFCLASDTLTQHERNVKHQVVRIKECHLHYENNNCHPYKRVPALEKTCSELELCMKLKPQDEVKITAAFMQVTAEGFNAFVNNLAPTALGVLGAFFLAFILYFGCGFSRR